MECMKVKRNVLLNPGPATTTDTVKLAQIVPDICPRETEFGDIMRSLSHDLVRVVHGENDDYVAVLFCGSGTIGIDVALNSLLPEESKVLIVNNGAYSTRGVQVCQYYGLPYVELKLPIDRPVDVKLVDEALSKDDSIKLVYTTHHETGTGVLNPISEIGRVTHEHGAVFITDTTSSFAMIPINVVDQNIDVCMASAQKGIQGMTGLSYLICKRDVVLASAKYPKRSYYCNLFRQYDYFEKTGQMHFTPPVQVIYAARQGLKEYFEEGERTKWERHKAVAARIHAGLASLGLREAIAPDYQSQLVVSVHYPTTQSWDFDRVHDYCYERGYTIYPGKIEGTDTFRLCSLGAIYPEDIDNFFAVLSEAFNDLGVVVE